MKFSPTAACVHVSNLEILYFRGGMKMSRILSLYKDSRKSICVAKDFPNH